MNVLSVVPLITSIYDIANGRYDTSVWLLPYIISVPFDQGTLLGWYLVYISNTCTSMCYSFIMTSTTSYFVACCYYIVAICEHFDLMMDLVKKDVILNNHEENLSEYKKRERKIQENLCKAINIHIEVYE